MLLSGKKVLRFLAIPIWCIVYAVSVNLILSDSYLAGTVEVVPYYKQFSMVRFVLCLFIIEILFYITTKVKSEIKLIDYIKDILFLFFLIPAVMGYALFAQQYYDKFLVYCIVYWLFFCLFCYCSRYCNISLPRIQMSKRTERILSSVIILSLVLFAIKQLGGISLSLSLSDVYTARADFKEQGNFLLTVIKSFLGCYVCPMLIVKYLKERRYLYAFAFVVAQIIAYSMAKDKTYLFFLIISIILGLPKWKIVDKTKKWFYLMTYGLSGMNFLACTGVSQNLLFNVITRRIMIMPTWLQYINFEFFYDKPKIWWRQDTFLIDKLFTPVYSRSLVEIVAEDYFHGWIGNPNNGMVGEAFTRCGYFGVIIYPLVITLLLLILSFFFKGLKEDSLFCFALAISLTLSNDVITSTSFVSLFLLVIAFSLLFHKATNIDITIYRSIPNE